eukprot:gene8974-16110_t
MNLYDVVSSIRNGHTPSDTSATSSTPMPDQLKQSDHGEGAHLSMWLPYFYVAPEIDHDLPSISTLP